MKRILMTFLILSAAVLLNSQSVHFGTAAVSGDDEFKSYYDDDSATGKFLGASNSFPASTVVTVTNPGNGKTVSVSIVKRLSSPGLFLVLSPEAGTAIDFPENDVLDIQAVERRVSEEALNSYAEDRAFSEDPDINPSAELAQSDSSSIAEPEDEVALSEPEVEETVSDASDMTAVPEETETLALAEAETVAEEEPEEIQPPVETSVNEYIPPVLMNNEGTAFEEGYDPLVLLDSGAESESDEIVGTVDDPLAEANSEGVSEPEIPLPEKFDEADLPETYEPELPGEETVEEAPEPEVAVAPEITIEPETALVSEDLNPELLEPSVEDLLISEPVAAETGPGESGLDDVAVSEPVIGELPADVRETVVIVPDLELEAEALDLSSVAEPEVTVPDLVEESGPVVIEADSEVAALIPDPEISDVAIPEPDIPEVTIPEVIIEEDLVETPEKKTEKETDKEAPEIVEDVIVTEPVVEPETLTMTMTEEEPSDNVIYFLTPGDFRPPPVSEEKKDKEKDKEPEKKVEPVLVERTELEHLIVRELRNGGSYLQLGTYSSIDILYGTIESINDSYPTIVLTMGEEDNQLYKLLIGPITRDEKGIVMTRFRSLGYGDAFLYSPH